MFSSYQLIKDHDHNIWLTSLDWCSIAVYTHFKYSNRRLDFHLWQWSLFLKVLWYNNFTHLLCIHFCTLFQSLTQTKCKHKTIINEQMDKSSVITLYRYISTVLNMLQFSCGCASAGKLMSPMETAICRGWKGFGTHRTWEVPFSMNCYVSFTALPVENNVPLTVTWHSSLLKSPWARHWLLSICWPFWL